MSIGSAPHLFCFGLGFSAEALARRLIREGWQVSGTCRSEARRQQLTAAGIAVHLFDRAHPLPDAAGLLAPVTDVLVSIPPDEAGDPVLDLHADALLATFGLRWIGYLSTTGVYGDTGGAVVDESALLRPSSQRAQRRVAAERRWLQLYETDGAPVHIFRLAGIYGPGRSALDQVRGGLAKRIERPGHVFSRIHVDDIALVLRASMARPDPGQIYNVCDDLPAEPSDVVAYACALLGVPPPPVQPFEEAAVQMSPMALSFWHDNRRVDNGRIKRELGVQLLYPDYRSGLQAILAHERAAAANANEPAD